MKLFTVVFTLVVVIFGGLYCYSDEAKRYLIYDGEKYGYCDENGIIKISAKYDFAWDFTTGFASVRIGMHFGVIDGTGNVAVPFKYGMILPFSEGLAAALFILENEVLWGYINEKGEVAIKPQFFRASSFSFGYALVCVEKYRIFAYVNKNGDIVIPAISAFDLNDFNGEFAILINLDKSLSKIDLNGNMIDLPGFRMIGEFSEGMAPAVIIIDGKEETCYVDKDFNVLLKIESSDFPYPFSEGLAAVKRGDKWGYIDMSGNYVIEPRFDKVHSFRDGLALVKEGEKEFYIDARGNFRFNFLVPKDE